MGKFELTYYKLVFDNSPQPCSVLRLDRTENGYKIITVYANEAEAALQGEDLNKLINSSCNEMYTKADKFWMDFYVEVFESGGNKTQMAFSYKLQKYIFARCYAIDEYHIVCMSEDMSENFIIESAKNENAKYRNLFNKVECGIFEFSINHNMEIKYLDVNPAGLGMIGWNKREFWRKSCWIYEEIIYKDDIDETIDKINKLKNIDDNQDISFRILKRDNTYIYVSGRIFLTGVNKDGKTYQCYFLDRNNQYMAEKTIKMDREMYQTIINETDAPVIIIDAQTYVVLYANNIAINYLEKTPGTYIGSVCYKYVFGIDGPCDFCPICGGKAKSSSHELDFDGYTFLQNFKPVIWNGREALLEYNTDITKLKKINEVEIELKSAKKK